jgi:monoamine oxidase
MGDVFDWRTWDKLFIDGAFRKGARTNLLTLFCVGPFARDYVDRSDDAIVAALLGELDQIFDGAASRHFVRAHIQNWSAKPYIQGAYSYEWNGDYDGIIADLAAPVGTDLYWAGEATSAENVSTVHGAMQSAYEAVVEVLETR